MNRSPLTPNAVGTWALVVGGSTTIGAEFAGQLAERGFNLVLVARGASRLESLASDLRRQRRVEVKAVALDLLDAGATADLLKATEGLEVGLLIVNANLHRVNEFHRMSEGEKRAMSRLNYQV
ncbi:MAG: SDR family NAD(P)-dependent oxidoreductase, partial [Myxococcota bacterium]